MVTKQKVYWFLRKYLLIPSKRNLQYWSPSLEKSMGLLTLNLRLLTIRRREDAQNLSTTVDIVTIYNGAEGKIQTGNVQSGRRYIILYDYYPDRSQFLFFNIDRLLTVTFERNEWMNEWQSIIREQSILFDRNFWVKLFICKKRGMNITVTIILCNACAA